MYSTCVLEEAQGYSEVSSEINERQSASISLSDYMQAQVALTFRIRANLFARKHWRNHEGRPNTDKFDFTAYQTAGAHYTLPCSRVSSWPVWLEPAVASCSAHNIMHKKLSCRREAARLNISLSHSR